MPGLEPNGRRAGTGMDRIPELPGLLNWQLFFLAFGLGILALRHSVVALAGVGVLWAGLWLCGRRLSPLAGLVCFALGWGVALAAMPSIPPTPQWMLEKPKVRVSGVVRRVDGREGWRYRMLLDDVACVLPSGKIERLPGRTVWTWQYSDALPVTGQRATFMARVKPVRGFANPGGWDSRFYWGQKGVFYRCYTRGQAGAELGSLPDGWRGMLARLRLGVREHLARATGDMPADGRALLFALLAGDRSGLDPDLRQAMSDGGVAHVLALSGLHVGLVASLGWFAASMLGFVCPGVYLYVPRIKLAVLLGALPVALFCVVGGGSPSLVRAAVMFASWGGLLWFGRGRVLLDGLFLALVVLLAADPLALYDLGLQMSVSAVASIAVFGPKLRHWALKLTSFGEETRWLAVARQPLRWALTLLSVSVAANLGLAPVLAEHFGRVSPNLYFNLLWLPLLGGVVMPAGLLGLGFGAVPGLQQAGGQLLAVAGWGLDTLAGLMRMAHAEGFLPCFTAVRPGEWGLVASAMVLAALALWNRRGLWFGLAGAAVAAGILAWPAGDGGVHLTALDVGQGQALVIRTPSGKRYLVDGGGTFGKHFDVGAAVVAPYLTRQRAPAVDGLVLTHADTDHVRGFVHLAQNFRLGWFAHTGRWGDNEHGLHLGQALEESGVPQRLVRTGDVLQLDDGVVLRVVHPSQPELGKLNEASVVALLEWQGRHLALLPGDVEGKGLTRLLNRGADLTAEVLVLPHHGSDGSLRPRLYKTVAPKLAVASAGSLGRWNMPGPKVRAAMAERGVPLYATPDCGAVSLAWHADENGGPAPGLPAVQTALDCSP